MKRWILIMLAGGAGILATWLYIFYIILELTMYSAPEPCEIVGKREANGKCYVEVLVEVDPYDYIGLDIGDEYQIREKE